MCVNVTYPVRCVDLTLMFHDRGINSVTRLYVSICSCDAIWIIFSKYLSSNNIIISTGVYFNNSDLILTII